MRKLRGAKIIKHLRAKKERKYKERKKRRIKMNPLTEKEETKYAVVKDNLPLYTGTHNECFIWLLDHQPNSVSHAIKHEGYSIVVDKRSIV